MLEILVQTIDGVKLQELSANKRLFRIGRHPDCDINIKDSTVSRFHAVLYLNEQEEAIIIDGDLNSGKPSNFGTYINGIKLNNDHGQQLKNGDEVVLSSTVSFKFFSRKLTESGDEQATAF